MRLIKSHGLGNDYLVLDSGEALTAATVRWLCDRHRGVGGDGVLEPIPSETADYGLRIWNPDGSLAEKSGNGLRIFARWLVDHRGAPSRHRVEVAAGVVTNEVHADGEVSVEMGPPSFASADVPCLQSWRDSPVDLGPHRLRLTVVGMGNPHCVAVFAEDTDLDALPWTTWGPALETHPNFPNRSNVQFAAVRARDRVDCRIWERGAGPTLASGSSACAVAAAAQLLGRADPALWVEMPGGRLRVTAGPGGLLLRGPVQEVALVNCRPPSA